MDLGSDYGLWLQGLRFRVLPQGQGVDTSTFNQVKSEQEIPGGVSLPESARLRLQTPNATA